MLITTVLFDLDGTLIDTFTLILEAFRRACQTVLRSDPSNEALFAHWGAPLRMRFASIAPDQVDELVAAYTSIYDALQMQLASPFPGVLQMLESLKARGIRNGVVTSKRRRSTVRDLEVFNVAGHIDVVVAAEDVVYPKPAPDAVEEALRQLRAQPTDAWMVGDWITDLQAARAAHVAFVAALWGTRDRGALLEGNPDYVAERPADIVRLLSG